MNRIRPKVWRAQYYQKKGKSSYWLDLKKQITFYNRETISTRGYRIFRATKRGYRRLFRYHKQERKKIRFNLRYYRIGYSRVKAKSTKRHFRPLNIIVSGSLPINRKKKRIIILRKLLWKKRRRLILPKSLRKLRRKRLPRPLQRSRRIILPRLIQKSRKKMLRGSLHKSRRKMRVLPRKNGKNGKVFANKKNKRKIKKKKFLRGIPPLSLLHRIQKVERRKDRHRQRVKRRKKARIEPKFALRLRRTTRWRNFLKKSYFKRYALPEKRSRRRRLKGLKRRKLLARIVFIRKKKHFKFNFEKEHKIFDRLLKRIQRYEARNAWRRRAVTKLLSKRVFKFGKVYITKHKRNLFISIAFQTKFGGPANIQKIFTCGKTGFLGPKRGTPFAFQQTASLAGQYIASQELTTIDMIFKTNMKRISRTLIRNLLYDTVYVRTIFIKKRRAHGLCRRKKKRRV